MNQVLSIAKKELRGYFNSPVALIFLGVFLFVVLFAFFWVDTFFKRNIADVRPLFHWLPMLMVFLVSALTMRLWSEEQRSGTLEILLTLPVKTHRLVLGKFLAGMALMAIALALTVGLPITVAQLGDLDWGPVFGGYLGALLLAGAYLALGLCVSATTSNAVVAWIVTMGGCGLLYLVGSDPVAGFGGNVVAEILRLVGTGSRFESIARGVIDLRDVVYYASLTAGFLFLNTVILDAKRWSQGEVTRPKRASAKLAVGLVIANLIAVNFLLHPVRAARLDLTERKEYSISPVTKKLLRGVDAPLLIRGYFSAKTHPLLAPLVPRIRDFIEEYGAVGGQRVTAEFIDPRQNPAAEKEANEDFSIKSVPFQFADRHEAAVVNSYFAVLVKYGDKYEKLTFQDLIEIKVTGQKVEVKLRNLEYDLTRTIKKVVYGFEPVESVFARVPDKIQLKAYVSAGTLPDKLKEVPARLDKVAKELVERSNDKLSYEPIDPTGPGKNALRQQLYTTYGLKPFALSMFGGDSFYMHLVLVSGDKVERVFPGPESSETDLRNELIAALKRMTPGFLKTVGIVKADPPPPQRPNPMMPQQQQPQGPQYRMLQQRLATNYAVKTVDIKSGRVPGSIDVLVVVGPDNLGEKARFAIDQFLMRGGAVVMALGRFTLDPSPRGGLSVKKLDPKLADLLETWGVAVEPKLVLDAQNEALPMPVERNVMGLTIREMRLAPYPFWVDVRSSGMAEDHPTVSGLPSVTMQWAAPLTVSKKEGLESTVLLRSSDEAWTQDTTEVQPNFAKYPREGFGRDDGTKLESRALAVAVSGQFPSAYTGKANPLFEGAKGAAPQASAKQGKDGAAEVIEKSPKSARLLVIGSADFVRDQVLGLSRQTGSDRFNNNLQFVQNIVDWAVEDGDLLKIRSRGAYARTLEPIEEVKRSTYELVNYGLVVLALGLIFGFTFIRRRNLAPLPISSKKQQKSKEA